VLNPRQLERAIEQAQILGIVDFAQIAPIAGRRGTGRLKAALEAASPTPESTTHSELEAQLRRLCRERHLPEPTPNLHIALPTGDTFQVDFAWPKRRLVVETDGFAFHSTRSAFERDRERDRILLSHGWRVARLTARQLGRQPERIAAQLAALLRS
jgi:very-short-patch-repair endonuclease